MYGMQPVGYPQWRGRGGAGHTWPNGACLTRYLASIKVWRLIVCSKQNPAPFLYKDSFSCLFPVFSSVMYKSVLRIRLTLPSNCIKRIPTLIRTSGRASDHGQNRSLPPFVSRPESRFLYTTTAVRMESIITPEKALGTSSHPKSDLHVELTAPNGRKYTQPIGLFINNEWVKSSNGQKLTSINPTYDPAHDISVSPAS
jgi:hypothetical protein